MPSTISLNTIPLGASGVTNFINNVGLANNTIFAQTLRDIVINSSFPTIFANGSIDSSKLATIPGNKIQTRSLSGSKGKTTGGQIAWYSIDTLDIADQAIDSRTIKDDTVGNGKLANMAANTVKANNTTASANPSDLAISNNSVVGRSGSGNVSAIAAGNDTVLRRSGSGNLSFGKIGEGQIEDSARIPVGGIIMWSGTIAAIPNGWGFCNGTTYTFNGRTTISPDLRDRFIVGARQDGSGEARTNITGSLTKTGGSNSHTHGIAANALSITVTLGTITGTIGTITATSTQPTATVGNITATATGGSVQSHTLSINQIPNHNHGGGTGFDGAHRHNVTRRNNPGLCNGNLTDGGARPYIAWIANCGGNVESDYQFNGTDKEPDAGLTNNTGNHNHPVNAEGGGQGHSHGFTPPTVTVTKPTVTVSRPTITVNSPTITITKPSVTASHSALALTSNNIPTYYALAYIIKL